jgi:molybdate transport system substrate-binding protein
MSRASFAVPVRRLVALCLALLVMVPAAFAVPASAQAITCEDVEPPATPAATPGSVVVVPFPEEGGTLDVFAAASLVDAFARVEADLEAANPNLDIVVETGGSQALVTQLAEGAQADVLATANTSTMTQAIDAGLIAGEPELFTGNRLVIVTPGDNPAGVTSLDDLATGDLNLVVASADVPVGNYARNILCAYAASGAAPDGFIEAVARNSVSEDEDVRSVYASDAVASALSGTPLTVIEFPEGLNATAGYPIAAVEGGDLDLAQAFISYILGADGQATLEAYGFTQP